MLEDDTVYLLDTNIVSEVFRRRPDPKVIARLSQVDAEEIHASVITLFEPRFASMLRDDAAKFWQKIEEEILPLVRWLMLIDPSSVKQATLPPSSRSLGRRSGLTTV